jgi:nucleoside-diphosphate-sugar epimerase
MHPARVLVTGASGFIGGHTCRWLVGHGLRVRAATRRPVSATLGLAGVETIRVPDLGPDTEWGVALRDVDAVVHIAGLAHVLEPAGAVAAEFLRVNADGAQRLAQAAAAAGTRRVLLMSSVSVYGPPPAGPITESHPTSPDSAYAVSKLDGERRVREALAGTRTEVVVLRPPGVYGPGNPGNFLRLMRWIDAGYPLPLSLLRNRRSFVYVLNLADAVLACLRESAAAGRTYNICDGAPVSLPELVRYIAAALDRPARIWPCPPVLLRLAAGALGRRDDFDRILGSMEVDASAIHRELGWQAPFTLGDGLRATATWYRTQPHR